MNTASSGFFLLALCALLAACEGGKIEDNYVARSVGDPKLGRAVIREAGCGSCHTIPGIRGADGAVGPPLNFFARRTYIAGRIPNTRENLTGWILAPQSVDPLTAMPDVGLTEVQARHVTAYLYTLE